MNSTDDFKILLGSKSPRRKEILELGDYKFKTILKDVEEILPENIKAIEAAEYLSKLKSEAYKLKNNELLITADTTVVVNNKVLGKPKDIKEASNIIKELSNNSHKVISGVTLKTKNHSISFSETTEVYFDEINENDINYYLNKYSPYDKAGAYGIQEWIGVNFIKKIEGCYYNVMGLPLSRINKEIKKIPVC